MSETRIRQALSTVAQLHNPAHIHEKTNLAGIGLPNITVGSGPKSALLATEGLLGAGVACLGNSAPISGISVDQSNATAQSAVETAVANIATPTQERTALNVVTSGLTGGSPITVNKQAENTPTPTPTITPTLESSPTLTNTATITAEPSLTATEVPSNETSITTPEDAATAMGIETSWADHIIPKYDTSGNITSWNFEGRTLNPGVTYSNGKHFLNGTVIETEADIFTSTLESNLPNVTLQADNAYLFARNGGVPDANDRNKSFFITHKGDSAPVNSVEQAAIIMVPETNMCVTGEGTDVSPQAAAWRDAVHNFIPDKNGSNWNKDVIDGTVKIFTQNETGEFVQMNGQMITELAKAGINVEEAVDSMPPGFPLTPHEANVQMGLNLSPEHEKWIQFEVINGKMTGTITMEGYGNKSTVEYNPQTGLYYLKGTQTVVPFDPTEGANSKIFDFSTWEKFQSIWPKSVQNLTSNLSRLFARIGLDPASSWFTGNAAGMVNSPNGLDQISLIPNCVGNAGDASLDDANGNIPNQNVKIIWFQNQDANWLRIK